MEFTPNPIVVGQSPLAKREQTDVYIEQFKFPYKQAVVFLEAHSKLELKLR